MQYRLKQNEAPFEVVDGPMAGRKFAAGRTYEEIPPQEAGRFEKVKDPEARKKSPAPEPETDLSAGGHNNGGES